MVIVKVASLLHADSVPEKISEVYHNFYFDINENGSTGD
jgi:hypothetical protein